MRRQEGIRREFGERLPQETEILEAFDRALEDLRQAAGGLYVFAEEGGDAADLSNALTLLDRAMGPLGACLKAIQGIEYDLLDYSEDPALDRLHEAFTSGVTSATLLRSSSQPWGSRSAQYSSRTSTRIDETPAAEVE